MSVAPFYIAVQKRALFCVHSTTDTPFSARRFENYSGHFQSEYIRSVYSSSLRRLMSRLEPTHNTNWQCSLSDNERSLLMPMPE